MKAYENISKILEPDETVKWQGKPAYFPLIEDYNRKSLLARWIITIVAAIGIMVTYLVITSNPGSGLHFNWILPLIVIVVAGYFIIRPFIDHQILLGRTYVITDKRVALITKDGEVKAMSMDKINDVVIYSRKNGNCDIMIGTDAAKLPYRKIRTVAIVPRENIYAEEGEKISGLAFYNVENSGEFVKMFLPGTRIVNHESSF